MQQLDIFADSEPVQRANDLIAALADLNYSAARQAMHLLTICDPNHNDLPQFERLCNFLEQGLCNAPSGSNIAVAAEEKRIREQLIPAVTVMGDTGKTLVRKCWSLLAKASEDAKIAPEQGDCFAAELYLRAHRFQDTVRTANGIPAAKIRATAQRWLALGYYGCGETECAKQAVLRYAWLSPQRFDSLIAEINNTELTRDWSRFQDDLEELDADWFPAWCVHENKFVNTALDNLPAGDGVTAYRLISDLAIRERNGICPTVIEKRMRLKQLNESFFAFYMKHRTDLHARSI